MRRVLLLILLLLIPSAWADEGVAQLPIYAGQSLGPWITNPLVLFLRIECFGLPARFGILRGNGLQLGVLHLGCG